MDRGHETPQALVRDCIQPRIERQVSRVIFKRIVVQVLSRSTQRNLGPGDVDRLQLLAIQVVTHRFFVPLRGEWAETN